MRYKAYIALLLMVAASLTGMALRPEHMMVADKSAINLESLIPKQFNQWKEAELSAQLVNPELKEAVDKVYAQTLSRTYTSAKGDMVMLSIAYGKDQSDSVGLHLPEGCYGGQGFIIEKVARDTLKSSFGDIHVTRVLANKIGRVEPITYWLRVGNKITYPGWETKMTKLKYGLTGTVPDGLLMRVSSIVPSTDNTAVQDAYQLQAQFAVDLLEAMASTERPNLIGDPKED
ncbi:MAG: EpsI family protein [Methylophilus sp.]|nr:EpsI family protein [Methylophilus sp.]